MPVKLKLTTTIKKIAFMPNSINSTLISEFYQYMNNNVLQKDEYLKIRKIVQEEASGVLADGKVLLQFASALVIEAIRNPDKYNNLLVYNAFSSSRVIISAQQSSSQPYPS